ncbi:MAG: LysR family transcriptional regulator [Azospirillaceae bacterium]|nr:LysR family transcriptional regulator [Azospirillaceae bacterium]
MDLRHLRYFVAVAEELHFGHAADRLHIAQPPLSQQIQALEQELGVRLLERTRRSVALTEAGRLFLDEARATLVQATRAAETARRAARGELGRLKIGFTPSCLFNGLMPTLLRRYRRAWPGIVLEMTETSTAEQVEQLGDGRIDIGFVRPAAPIPPGMVVIRILLREPLVAVLDGDHPLAGVDPIRMVALRDQPFVLHARRLGTGLYDTVMRLCANAGFTPRIAQEMHQMSTIVTLAAVGLGVAVAPRCMAALQVEGVCYREILDDGAYLDLAVAWRDGTEAIPTRHFIELLPPAVYTASMAAMPGARVSGAGPAIP